MNPATLAPYKGYTPSIAFSKEDGCFVGSVLGLNLHGINFDGTTEEEVRNNFTDAVDFYLDVTANPEAPFAGRITLQLTPMMHKELSNKADRAGAASLDSWLVQELKESVLHHS
ncbi:MAG: hypothetical protein FWG12_03040 [Holophagaceae bacterium]|nr:hypothetical protein [Holophagaceae bacterium]